MQERILLHHASAMTLITLAAACVARTDTAPAGFANENSGWV